MIENILKNNNLKVTNQRIKILNIINEFKYESEKVISCDFIKETVSKYFSIELFLYLLLY